MKTTILTFLMLLASFSFAMSPEYSNQREDMMSTDAVEEQNSNSRDDAIYRSESERANDISEENEFSRDESYSDKYRDEEDLDRQEYSE